MADKQITELTEASTLTGDELLVISQGGEARKVAVENVAALGGGSNTIAAVLYTEQTLTEEQKAQARENIGAVTMKEVLARMPIFTLENGTLTIE